MLRKVQDRLRKPFYGAKDKGAFRLISGVEIPDEWGQYSTQKASDFEIIHRPLWDTQNFISANTLNLNFFNQAQANTGLGNEVFPLKNSYLVCGIGVFFKDQAANDSQSATVGTPLTSRFNDHVLITNTGVLAINIGNKDYGPFPLWKLTPGAGVWGLFFGGTPSMPSYSQMGMPDPRALFTLAIPLVIPMSTRVTMSMAWAATVVLSNPSVITLLLDGKEARPIQ